MRALEHFLRDESGHTAIEYGLIAVCVCVALIVAVQGFGVSVKDMLDDAKAGFDLRP